MNVAVVVIAVGRRVLYQGVRPTAAAAVDARVVVGRRVLVLLLLLLQFSHPNVPRLIPGLAPGS